MRNTLMTDAEWASLSAESRQKLEAALVHAFVQGARYWQWELNDSQIWAVDQQQVRRTALRWLRDGTLGVEG